MSVEELKLPFIYVSEEEAVEMQSWMSEQDVSSLPPIVCPSFPLCSL